MSSAGLESFNMFLFVSAWTKQSIKVKCYVLHNIAMIMIYATTTLWRLTYIGRCDCLFMDWNNSRVNEIKYAIYTGTRWTRSIIISDMMWFCAQVHRQTYRIRFEPERRTLLCLINSCLNTHNVVIRYFGPFCQMLNKFFFKVFQYSLMQYSLFSLNR